MNLLADSHIHLDDPRFDADRGSLIAAARAQGIVLQIIPGVRRLDWPGQYQLTQTYTGIHAGYGLHPNFLSEHQPHDLAALAEWIAAHREQVVAIGEIGLDFHRPEVDRAQQHWYFERQLRLAQQLDLPVIIHARQAMDEVIHHLRKHPGLRGVVHAFAGSGQQASQLWALGFQLGIGGPITYPRALRLRRIVQAMPIEQLLLETDAPDQPILGYQGQRNLPLRLLDVLHSVAELRQTAPAEIAQHSLQTTCSLFRIRPPEQQESADRLA